MDDLISRRSAIDAIVAQTIGYTVDEIKAECEEKIFAENGYLGGLKDAIEAIEDMQSAQPERTEERTETHACDCIDRQAAIDAVDKNRDAVFCNSVDYEGVLYDISNLPPSQPEVLACGEGELSAQPDIVRCEDCRHWKQETFNDGYCIEMDLRMCDADFYCGYAERRTDG